MSKFCPQRFLPYLSARQIEQIDKENSIVLLPIASIEQHGPHLPVYTDSIIATEVVKGICERLEPDFPLYFLPLLPYGRSVEHLGFSGTISLNTSTLMQVLNDIASSVSAMGFRRFVLVNTHGGNSELIDVAMRDIRTRHDLYLFGLHVFLRIAIPEQGLDISESIYGIHAGDVETSILLHCHPKLVQMEHAPNSLPAHLLKGDTPPFADPLNFAWLTRDITANGVLGNAQTADPERGERYLDNAVDECIQLLRKISKFKFAL